MARMIEVWRPCPHCDGVGWQIVTGIPVASVRTLTEQERAASDEVTKLEPGERWSPCTACNAAGARWAGYVCTLEPAEGIAQTRGRADHKVYRAIQTDVLTHADARDLARRVASGDRRARE